MNIRAMAFALIAVSSFALPAFADSGMSDKKTVAELVETSDQHTMLASALEKAGLTDALNGEGPVTLFAPTDEAFEALPEGTLESLSEEELKDILTYHVVQDRLLPASLVQALIQAGDTRGSLTTMNGELRILKQDDGSVILEDGQGNQVDIVKADLKASNGIVHVIDGVLMP